MQNCGFQARAELSAGGTYVFAGVHSTRLTQADRRSNVQRQHIQIETGVAGNAGGGVYGIYRGV